MTAAIATRTAAVLVPGPATWLSGAPWQASAGVVVLAMALHVLAPRWTSREARACRLAKRLRATGLDSDQIATAITTSLTRAAGAEELPG